MKPLPHKQRIEYLKQIKVEADTLLEARATMVKGKHEQALIDQTIMGIFNALFDLNNALTKRT